MAKFTHAGGRQSEVENLSGAQTATSLIAASGAGKSHVIHAITLCDTSGAANTISIETADPTIIFAPILGANAEAAIVYGGGGLNVGANELVQIDSTGSVFVSIEYESKDS